MSRPLRIEFAGALYHVTSRGDGREDIFLDGGDSELFLVVLSEAIERNRRALRATLFESESHHYAPAPACRLR